MSDTPGRPTILVTGDVIIDHHLYEGERTTPASRASRGVQVVRKTGGAAVVYRLLQQMLPPDEVALAVKELDENGPPSGNDAFAIWVPSPRSSDPGEKRLVWRTKALMGYGHNVSGSSDAEREPALQENPQQPRSVLLIDDGGFRVREEKFRPVWMLPSPETAEPRWILLKMSDPIATGPLWDALSKDFANRLVVLVSARDLRREHVEISEGLSWERTLEDLFRAIDESPNLKSLECCRHLIITFSSDGAVWIDRTDRTNPRAVLSFDPRGAEGEWAVTQPGGAIGYLTGMTAAIACALAADVAAAPTAAPKPNLSAAIETGLSAMRNLHQEGHGAVDGDNPKGFPAERIAGELKRPTHWFSRIDLPWKKDKPLARNWMIIRSQQRILLTQPEPSLSDLARQVVLVGPSVLLPYPNVRFGKLLTVDRTEIEALRHIRRVLLAYRHADRPKRPLSIGVFGQPGAGKSFGVREIANGVFGEKSWLEFNLSQFTAADLIGALLQIGDKVLQGITPVVLWDEFDSREFEWLQYLLAPMQDGKFQDGQNTHAIGKCVFIFAGGTSSTYESFEVPRAKPDEERKLKERRDFVLRKGPDFISRLDAFYDVLGPNQRLQNAAAMGEDPPPDPTDICYPLRRALFMRAQLELKDNERALIDEDLLAAVLEAEKFEHGARSLEKLIGFLRPGHGHGIHRSLLPARPQLAMHVELSNFDRLIASERDYRISGKRERTSQIIEIMAEAVHETWRELSRKEGWSMQKRFAQPYRDLAEVDKEDNRAAARRIPDLLQLVGLGLVRKDDQWPAGAPDDVLAVLNKRIEWLAESEHEGWTRYRLSTGWKYAEKRDDAKQVHHAIVPYVELLEDDKKKDRNTVRHIPDFVDRAGLRIVWIEKPA